MIGLREREGKKNKIDKMIFIIKESNTNKIKNRKQNNICFKKYLSSYIIILLLIIPILSQAKKETKIDNKSNVIKLTIKGEGISSIIYNNSDNQNCPQTNYPDEIYINDIKQAEIKSNYYFNKSENQVKLIWNNNIERLSCMFYLCSNITKINFSDFNSTGIVFMDSVFHSCTSLVSIDFNNFDTSSVTTMTSMFYNCSSLKCINLSNFDTSKVESMQYMFSGCRLLSSIDLSNFKTSNVKDMSLMFENCGNLEEINLSNFNTSKVVAISECFLVV